MRASVRWRARLLWHLALWCAAAGITLSVAGCAGPAPRPERAASDVRFEILNETNTAIVVRLQGPATSEALARAVFDDPRKAWLIEDFNPVPMAAGRAERGAQLVIPTRPPMTAGLHPGHYQVTPILSYHRFGTGPRPDDSLEISAARFEAQLEFLLARRARFVTMGELAGYFHAGEAIPQRAVAITIDDGFASVYDIAFPILKRFNVPATLFVYTDFVGGGAALTWDEIRIMQGSGLVEVQAHSKTHANLTEVRADESTAAYGRRLREEFLTPKRLIQRELGSAPIAFAYPYGAANDQALQAAQAAGFSLAATVSRGGNPAFSPPLLLRRTLVFAGRTPTDLAEVFVTQIAHPALDTLDWRAPTVAEPWIAGRDPTAAERHFQEGRRARAQATPAKAKAAFLRALAADPSHAGAFRALQGLTAAATTDRMRSMRQFQLVRVPEQGASATEQVTYRALQTTRTTAPDLSSDEPDRGASGSADAGNKEDLTPNASENVHGTERGGVPPAKPDTADPGIEHIRALVGELHAALEEGALERAYRVATLLEALRPATSANASGPGGPLISARVSAGISKLSEALYSRGSELLGSDVEAARAALEMSVELDPENVRAKVALKRAEKIASALAD